VCGVMTYNQTLKPKTISSQCSKPPVRNTCPLSRPGYQRSDHDLLLATHFWTCHNRQSANPRAFSKPVYITKIGNGKFVRASLRHVSIMSRMSRNKRRLSQWFVAYARRCWTWHVQKPAVRCGLDAHWLLNTTCILTITWIYLYIVLKLGSIGGKV
jgi:hypothetical protein